MKAVLLSEGSSFTSRETLSVLSNSDFTIDILSSSKLPITLFSRWRDRIIPTVNVNENPKEYLQHVSKLLLSEKYITIIPTHEEAWLFSEGAKFLPQNYNIAISSPESYGRVQSKIEFAKLAEDLHIPCPKWQIITKDTPIGLMYPYWIKASYGTAGRSVFKIKSILDKDSCATKIDSCSNQFMAQEHIEGKYGQVQAVFNHGKIVAVHTSLQQGSGVGGSAAARISVDFPETREHIDRIGSYLNWHGGITLDFIYKDGIPYYIECNPRMIEPANAAYSGVNFPKILIDLSSSISSSNSSKDLLIGIPNVKTHSTMALLLGAAEKSKCRKEVLKTFWKCITRSGELKNSIEVLTPVKNDLVSVFPVIFILLRLLINPKSVEKLASATVNNYAVLPETVASIKDFSFKY